MKVLVHSIIDKKVVQMDYVDGMPWVESGAYLPLWLHEYSTTPFSVFCSDPCKVKTSDRVTIGVYISAKSSFVCNDGSRVELSGWVEQTGVIGDFSCVEQIFYGRYLDVISWHYIE